MKKIKRGFSGLIGSCFLGLGMLLAVLDWKHGVGAKHRPM
jgi:hypothetical protein